MSTTFRMSLLFAVLNVMSVLLGLAVVASVPFLTPTSPGAYGDFQVGLMLLAGLGFAVGGAANLASRTVINEEGVRVGLGLGLLGRRRRLVPWSSVRSVNVRGARGEITDIDVVGDTDEVTINIFSLNADGSTVARYISGHTPPSAWSESLRRVIGAPQNSPLQADTER